MGTEGGVMLKHDLLSPIQNMMQGLALRYVDLTKCENIPFQLIFLQLDARTQHKDRIWVYPSIVLRYEKCQHEGDATQALASYYERDLIPQTY